MAHELIDLTQNVFCIMQSEQRKGSMRGRQVFGRVLSDAEVYGVTSMHDRLLKQVSLQAGTVDFAAAISEHLKKNFSIARSPEQPNQFVSVPARDIVIIGKAVPDAFAASIAGELTRMHGQFTPDFRIAAIETVAAESDAKVYFGRGVFTALDLPQVADLEFCATPKDVKPDWNAKGIVPRIRGQSGANADRAAAWYAGQPGIAIGFGLGAAPAVVLAEELGQGWEPILHNLILFFGRQSDADPVMRCLRREWATGEANGGTSHPTFDAQFPTDWFRHDGVWQWIEIDRRKLWFRITNRTGASLFSANVDMVERRGRQSDADAGFIAVEGLVLPRMPRWTDRHAGWRVDFQKDETLRHSELAGLAWTAAAQTRGRYGIFSHIEGHWKGEEKSYAGEMVLPLGKRRLDLRLLEDIVPGGSGGVGISKNDQKAMRYRIYGNSSHVLIYAHTAPSQSDFMGAMLLPAPNGEPGWQRFVAEPVELRRDNDPDALPQPISLDWVNRAASVDGNVTRGLAEFWLSQWSLEVRPTPAHLEVRVGFEKDALTYKIKEGGHGALGPLWIKYVWLNPSGLST